AEDGIRDRNVTGVQTCALPISLQSSSQVHLFHLELHLYLSLFLVLVSYFLLIRCPAQPFLLQFHLSLLLYRLLHFLHLIVFPLSPLFLSLHHPFFSLLSLLSLAVFTVKRQQTTLHKCL